MSQGHKRACFGCVSVPDSCREPSRDAGRGNAWARLRPVDGSDREKAVPRGAVLYDLDRRAKLRFSHENPAVQALYQEYLDEPCSEKAEHLLHCDHFAWQMPQNR